MKQYFIRKNGHKELLLFFAGWGMDEHPFLQIHPVDRDWMICYDYRSLEFDETLINEYSSITLVAWSMGVWAASQVMKEHGSLAIIQRIAINGTLYPISETKGIAPAIFNGTLESLNESTLQKFQRRMCGPAAYKTFQAVSPQRPVEELKEELGAIQMQAQSLPPALCHWQKAFVGKNDYIFLSQNQRSAWETLADSIIEVDTPHYDRTLFEQVFHHQANHE